MKKPQAVQISPKDVLAEIQRRKAKASNTITGLFNKQLAFIQDPAKFKLARCSRRAGKSYACARALLEAASKEPESNCAYLALTRKSAKRILWNLLKKLAKDHSIKIDPKVAELTIELENGSCIYLLGANDEGVAETLRGSPWNLVVIDEVASYSSNLETIIDEVLSPALMDTDGSIVLIGTPSSDFSSYFYKCDHSTNWSKYHWTVFDNPFLPNAKTWLEDTMAKRGWTYETPFVRREFFGEWCRSEDDQVYLYNRARNRIDDPPTNLTYVIGADVGWKDAKAIAVLGFDPKRSNKIYIVEKFEQSKMLISDFGQKVKELSDKYQPMMIVMDPGGGGADIAAEINNRHCLTIKSAKKTSKYDYIEFLNADMVAGNILNVVDTDDDPLEIEYENHLWKDKLKRVEADTDNHIADSVLYAYRECYAYIHEPIESRPTAMDDILKAEAKAMEKKVMEMDELAAQTKEEEDWLWA